MAVRRAAHAAGVAGRPVTDARTKRSRRGFTLLEMLVTLVIVAAVAAVLAQAMGQLRRVEELLMREELVATGGELQARWIVQALESIQPLPLEAGAAMRGTAEGLQALTLAAPAYPEATLGAVALDLERGQQPERTTLALSVRDRAGGAAGPVIRLSWPGRSGRIRYQDHQGAWSDVWPPAHRLPPHERLPALIAVETGWDERPLLLAVLRTGSVPLPTRKRVEAM